MGGAVRRRRRLGPEERRLWEQVAASAIPLHRAPAAGTRPQTLIVAPREAAGAPAPSPPVPKTDSIAPEGRGIASPLVRPGLRQRSSVSVSHAAPEAGPVGRPEAGLDRRTAERLRKGARAPDSRIDLHGMTAERAHRACLGFLADALGRGDRVVLVITGKGRRGEDGHHGQPGRGVLRQSLPGWLRASPLGHSIVGIYRAHRRHGGEGAFYVYLKRHR